MPTPMTTINVNLTPDSECSCLDTRSEHHRNGCSATPILLPCRPSASVTFWVALGGCDCGGPRTTIQAGAEHRYHNPGCASRPVKVSCSISGSTWKESEVVDWECSEAVVGMTLGDFRRALRAAVDARWALVKALVLGASKVSEFPEAFRMVPAVSEMLAQRNAVYAALCEIARHERGMADAWDACPARLQKRAHSGGMPSDSDSRPSSWMMEAYIADLLEQFGVLGVAP